MDKTLTKGLQLLELLALSATPLGVTQIAEKTGLTPSNVHRLLKTLESLNYVSQAGPRGTYTATPRLFALGRAVIDRIEIVTVATPFLQRLHDFSSDSASISIWYDRGPLMIGCVESVHRHPKRKFGGVGNPMATTCSSAGLTLLAFQGADVIAEFAENLVPATPRSISTPEELHARLQDIRENGRAINRDELQFGLSAVSVPIFVHNDIVAVLTVSSTSEQMSDQKIDTLIDPMKSAANGISQMLGGGL